MPGTQTPNGTVIGVTDAHRPIILKEGPAWLATLLYKPPEWLPVLLSLVGLCAVVGVALAWRRYGSPSRDDWLDAAANGLTVVFAIVTVSALQSFVEWPYLVDIVVAGVVGWALAVLAVQSVDEAQSNP